MNRRDLLKMFAAAGVAISVPKAAESALRAKPVAATATAVKEYQDKSVSALVSASDGIVLNLNEMPVISINAQTDNNVRLNHVVGSLETYPTMGMCEQTVEVTCYVEENIRALFRELKHHKVRVFYRQPKHPQAPVTDADPILIDSMAILETMEMQVDGASFDMEATLVLRLIK